MRRRLLGTIAVVAWFGLFAFARVEGAFFPWFLFYMYSFLLIYEWISWAISLRGIETVRHISATRLSAGQSLDVSVIIRRRGRWPLLWVRVHEELPDRWLFQTVGAERLLQPMWSAKTELSYRIGGLTRGVYRLGDTELETGDLFGLVRRRRAYAHSDEVIVYPRVVPVRGWSGYHPEELGLRQPTRRRTDESTNVIGVRDFAPGDRLSRIHWPASARRQVLQSKEFELHVTSELLFLPDMSADSFAGAGSGAFELEMVIVASLAKQAYDLRRRFALTMHADRLRAFPPGADQALLFRCMEGLAIASPNGRTAFARSLGHVARDMVRGTTLVVVSPQVDHAVAAAAAEARRRGSVEWFLPLTGEQSLAAQGVQLLVNAGVQVFPVRSAEGLAALQRGGMVRATGR